MVESKYFEPCIGKPDIKRLLGAFKGEAIDRVPNFEPLIEKEHVEKILGKKAGFGAGECRSWRIPARQTRETSHLKMDFAFYPIIR